jgi:catechol 2,3-dioxygenase-like lactoylglutathione lyase family enzyme
VTERAIPILPCRQLDDVVPFYEALGFTVTYRQDRPYTSLALQRGDVDLHFFGLAEFDPEQSMGSVILLVDDVAATWDAFAGGLRERFGRLPVQGIPRITRPRRKQGMVGGFSVVDPGGNWLRVSALPSAELSGDAEDAAPEHSSGPLDSVLRNAARQGDARGEPETAIAALEAGLARHPDAATAERVQALAYLAELRVRIGDEAGAHAALNTLDGVELDDEERRRAAADLAAAEELRAHLG